MNGLIDLHCHILPGVDDGPDTVEESIELVKGLRSLGFDRLVATPHVHLPQWDQDLSHLLALRDELVGKLGKQSPRIDVAVENFFDDSAWQRFKNGDLICYPGGKAALVEFASGNVDLPLRFEQQLFEMSVSGVRPVIAHPERQERLGKAAHNLSNGGALLLISLGSLGMSMIFDDGSRRRARALARENLSVAAASDAHSVEDLKLIERGFKNLKKMVRDEGVKSMLQIVPGTVLAP